MYENKTQACKNINGGRRPIIDWHACAIPKKSSEGLRHEKKRDK
jgi:hypothetical protein